MQSILRALRVGLSAGLALVLLGCSSSSDDTTAATSAPGADYEVVSDADVSVGLADVTAILASLPATSENSEAEARAGIDRMYTRWFEFEGTIRANDKDLYLQMEDGLVAAKIGVQEQRPEKLDEGIAEFAEAVAAYTKAHP